MIFICFLLTPNSVRADGGEDYYLALRKLKKFDSSTLSRIKSETIDAEQIKKVNERSKANFAHNQKVEKNLKKAPPTDENAGKAPITGPNGEKVIKPPVVKNNQPIIVKSNTSTSITKKAPVKPAPKKSESNSAPIKVNNDGPDELTFPGTND